LHRAAGGAPAPRGDGGYGVAKGPRDLVSRLLQRRRDDRGALQPARAPPEPPDDRAPRPHAPRPRPAPRGPPRRRDRAGLAGQPRGARRARGARARPRGGPRAADRLPLAAPTARAPAAAVAPRAPRRAAGRDRPRRGGRARAPGRPRGAAA